MIQRFIKTALDVGIAQYIQGGETLYQELFGDIWFLSATEVNSISTYFGKYPMVTHLGYPRSALTPDNVSIYIYEAGQQQPGFALADQAADVQVTTPSGQVVSGTPVLGSLWDHNVNISIFAFNYEVAAYASEIVKSIILASKQYLLSVAVELPTMSISEVQPAENYEPANLYMRNVSLRVRPRVQRGQHRRRPAARLLPSTVSRLREAAQTLTAGVLALAQVDVPTGG